MIKVISEPKISELNNTESIVNPEPVNSHFEDEDSDSGSYGENTIKKLKSIEEYFLLFE